MKILYQAPIGLQQITEPHRITNQTRSFAIVEPYGPFVADPDTDIVEIKLIDPKDALKYFDWKEVGEYALEKAIDMYKEYMSAKISPTNTSRNLPEKSKNL